LAEGDAEETTSASSNVVKFNADPSDVPALFIPTALKSYIVFWRSPVSAAETLVFAPPENPVGVATIVSAYVPEEESL